jgi:protein TonB
VFAAAAHAILVIAVLHFVHRQPSITIVVEGPCDECKIPPPRQPKSPSGSKPPETPRGPKPPKPPRKLFPPSTNPARELPPVTIAPEPTDSTLPEESEMATSGDESGDGRDTVRSPGPIGDCIGPGCAGDRGGRPADVQVIQDWAPGIAKPRPLCDPAAPTMPEQARIMGIIGAVVMRYVVETDGSVSRIQLRNSDAPPVLVEAVHTWLERCRFKPGVARGQEARIQIDQSFVFKLR